MDRRSDLLSKPRFVQRGSIVFIAFFPFWATCLCGAAPLKSKTSRFHITSFRIGAAMTNYRLVFPFLALLSFARPSFGQESPPQPALPATPADAEPSSDITPAFILDQLKIMTPAELIKKVGRAEATLSRKGQLAIRNRAALQLDIKRAEEAVSLFETNGEIDRVSALLDSAEAQAVFAQASAVNDEKQQEKMLLEFFLKNKVSPLTVKKIGIHRGNMEVISRGKKLLKKIEESLAADPSSSILVAEPSSPRGAVARLEALEQVYSGAPGASTKESGVASGSGGWGDILRAIRIAPPPK